MQCLNDALCGALRVKTPLIRDELAGLPTLACNQSMMEARHGFHIPSAVHDKIVRVLILIECTKVNLVLSWYEDERFNPRSDIFRSFFSLVQYPRIDQAELWAFSPYGSCLIR